MVTVNATWQQVRTTKGCQCKEPSLSEEQITWLASQGRNRHWSRANVGGAENITRINLDREN